MKLTTKRLCGLLSLFAVILAVAFFAPNLTNVDAASAKTVSVAFKNNGGTGSIPNRPYTVGKTYGSLPAGPTPPKGMAFTGWYTKLIGGKKITPSTTVSASYTTLYAHYEYRSYLVKFDTRGGVDLSSVWSDQYYTYGKAYRNLPTTFKAGYEFLGWYTQPTGGKKIGPGTTMLTAATHTLYAHWQKLKYKVYDDQYFEDFVTIGDTYIVPSVPNHPTYIWMAEFEEEGKCKQLTPGMRIKVTSNIKLTAMPSRYPRKAKK